jgi:phosphatidylserine/phosphatidylglycerophosphate/cardiolipin synthase-like enzyme
VTSGGPINTFVFRAAVAVAVLVSTHAAVAGPASAPHAPNPPTSRVAIFNNPVAKYAVRPSQGREDPLLVVPGAPSGITTDIVTLLSSATARASVTIAMFRSSDDGLSEVAADTALIKTALRKASQRVRRINVLVDGQQDGTFWRSLEKLPNVTVRNCLGACYHQGHGLMHNKFMLVDDTSWTPGKEHVVLQLTANWSDVQLSSQNWNSALQISGDEKLYDGYLGYYQQLWRCAPRCQGAPTPQGFAGSEGSGIRVDLFPRRGLDDPILAELFDLTHCPTGGGVDIAVNDWRRDSRGVHILRRLEELKAAGCSIRVVVQRNQRGGIARLLPRSLIASSSHCSSHRSAAVDRTRFTPLVHSKYMLIHGTFRGISGSTVVSTGSARFSWPSLIRDDETWMTLRSTPGNHPANAVVFGTYEANFNQMWAATPVCTARTPHPHEAVRHAA